jgi:hypothetical protein
LKFAPLRLNQAGFQAKMLGGTEQIGVGKNLPRLGELMPKLGTIGREIMKPGKDKKTGQSRIGGGS